MVLFFFAGLKIQLNYRQLCISETAQDKIVNALDVLEPRRGNEVGGLFHNAETGFLNTSVPDSVGKTPFHGSIDSISIY